MNAIFKIWDVLFSVPNTKDKDPLWILAQTEYRQNPHYAYERLKKGLRP